MTSKRAAAKPKSTGSAHILPFLELDPMAFERLCLWLARAEGYEQPEHYGLGGGDRGRDVVAFKTVGGERQRWYFQCKRTARVVVADLAREIDKILLPTSPDEVAPYGIVFVVAGGVSARQRDAIAAHAHRLGLECEFWARTELDARLKKHPEVLAEFFLLGPGDVALNGPSADQAPTRQLPSAAAIEEKLDHAEKLLVSGDYEAATVAAEEVVSLAFQVHDTTQEQGARHVALRAILLEAAFGSAKSGAEASARMQQHLEGLLAIGESPTRLVLEQAYAAQLGDDADLELQLSLEALSLARAEQEAASVVGALVACLHAYGRVGRPDESLSLEDDVHQAMASREDGELRLPLAAVWLQTLGKTARISVADVDGFGVFVRDIAQQGRMSVRRVAEIVGQVAGDLYESGCLPETVSLLGLWYEVSEDFDSLLAAHAAMQAAEVAAQAGDAERAHLFLGKAASAVEQTKDQPSTAHKDACGAWPTLRARFLFARANTLHKLARSASSETRLNGYYATYEAFQTAREFATANRADIRGDVELFLADVNWGLGRTARELGRAEEAASIFEEVHSDAGMAHPQFCIQVAIPAWLLEAEDRMWSGQLNASRHVASQILADPRIPQDAIARATALIGHIDNVLLPTRNWFSSAEALEISEIAKRDGVGEAVRQQADRLISWWGEWHDDDGAMSVLMDFWGRGGFARVAAAIRAQPDGAIAVDATSIDEIRRWARILCPVFDTVVIKWKGELGHGFCTCPLKPEYGGPGAFGGHGYTRTSDMISDDWGVAAGWANPIPRTVVAFLAGEARALVAAGRLLVVPAALVGCAQTAVGWTDQLLTDGLLGGVVQGIGRPAEDRTSERIIGKTCARTSPPFIKSCKLR